MTATMYRSRNSRLKTAFTLIELLVVIAIIGILAALLMPVLSKAKDSAAKTVDINNLKQMTTAMQLHAGDNQDSMPWSNWLAGDLARTAPAGFTASKPVWPLMNRRSKWRPDFSGLF